MLMPFLALMAVFGLPLVLVLSARLMVRGRGEFRARVLETIAAAVHRGVPIEPQFLWLIAHDERGRRRRRILHAASRLDEGRPLSEALSETLRLQPAAAATIAAAEGGPRLAEALRGVAREDRDALQFFHGLLLRLFYPTVILAFLGGFLGSGIAPKFRDVASSMDVGLIADRFLFSTDLARGLAVLTALAVVITLTSRTPPVRAIFRAFRGRRQCASEASTAAWLGALATAVRAGRPFDEGLGRTAAAIGHPRHAARVRDQADLVHRGTPVEKAWRALPIPNWLRDRAAMISGPPEQLAATLRELSRMAVERSERSRRRILAWLSPALLLLTGAAVALVQAEFFVMLGALRQEIQPW